MAACSEQATPTYYRPAEQASTPRSTTATPSTPEAELTESSDSPQPSPSPACSSNLLFLEDITIPDGSEVNPQDILDKRWLVENSGTCNWDRRFSLRLIAGSDLGSNPEGIF